MPGAPRFRWRVIAVTLCGFLGVMCLLAGSINAGLMAYAYARFGRFPVRPDTPSLNRFAPNPKNLGAVAGEVGSGVLLLAAGVASWRRMRAAGRDGASVPRSSGEALDA
jgi:hypothetical protein